ncbi:hypothetical protein O181_128175 [Austropuccinia psidii MF-1]|uniref:Uncharacterized protein n=1 Tax=Austropuccinia psidii MF-1 TaxID=1389203 RepID=A0A9Q3KZQ2_9BASI|nr:hypothetical protein [Austropuccinia psidii MF-1]
MTPTRSGSNYSIQSNGSGPGHSSHKSKRQECQPRGEAKMEESRTSTSSQRLVNTFEILIESPEAAITAIAVVRPESLSTGNNSDIPVSVQELVYGGKAARVGTSPKSLDRHHEIIYSSEEAHGASKDRRPFEGLDTHVLQRKITTDKSLVEKPKHVIRGPEEGVGPREGKQPSGSSPSLHKCQTSPIRPQRPTRRARKRKRERQSPSGACLTCRTTLFPRKRRQPWKMCSIWQEL